MFEGPDTSKGVLDMRWPPCMSWTLLICGASSYRVALLSARVTQGDACALLSPAGASASSTAAMVCLIEGDITRMDDSLRDTSPRLYRQTALVSDLSDKVDWLQHFCTDLHVDPYRIASLLPPPIYGYVFTLGQSLYDKTNAWIPTMGAQCILYMFW